MGLAFIDHLALVYCNAAEVPYLSNSHLVSLPVRTVLYGIEYILAVKSNDQADIEIKYD